MPWRRASHAGGVEAGAFEEHAGCGVGNARVEASEHTGHAAGLFGVADHQVGGIECALHTVEGGELGAFGGTAHHNLVGGESVGVEGVQGLPESVQDEVGDIHHIVHRMHADGVELVAQPFGAVAHGHSLYGEAAVAHAAGGVGHFHTHGASLWLVDSKAVDRRAVRLHGIGMAAQVGGQVAGHAVVAGGVDTVGGEVYLDNEVIVDFVVFRCWMAYERVGFGGQHYDSVVRVSHAYLVLGAYHSQRFHAADFGALDFEALTVGRIQSGAHGGHHNGLPGGHVRCAAYNLHRILRVAQVDGGYVQVVAVGMDFAGEYLADYDAGEAATDAFHTFYRTGLKAYGSEGFGQGFGAEIGVEILAKPFV